MSDRINTALARLFEENRIVFWYDSARDMRAEYEAVDLPDVEKAEIANNEFRAEIPDAAARTETEIPAIP